MTDEDHRLKDLLDKHITNLTHIMMLVCNDDEHAPIARALGEAKKQMERANEYAKRLK